MEDMDASEDQGCKLRAVLKVEKNLTLLNCETSKFALYIKQIKKADLMKK